MDFGTVETAMSDAFNRIRWSVFEEVSSICVVDDPNSLTPRLSPFLGHPIAAEAASVIPLREMVFCIQILMEVEIPDDCERVESLFVRRADGDIVTVADVVEQLSGYFIANRDDILEAKAPFLYMTHEMEDGMHVVGIPALGSYPIPDDTKVFFDGFHGDIEVGECALNVDLWAAGEDGRSVEYYWKSRARPYEFPM